MRVLRVSLVLLLGTVVVGCNAEEGFDQATKGESDQAGAKPIAVIDGDTMLDKGGGDYGGNPIVFVNPPSETDPANKYIPYQAARRAPEGNWVANELVTVSSDPMTIASKGGTPTRTQTKTITTRRETEDQTSTQETSVSTGSINQVLRNTYNQTFTQTGVEATQNKLQTNVRTFSGRQG